MRNLLFLCGCLLASLPIRAAAQTTNVSVSYQVANDWGAGYTANWYLTNNSPVTITNWVFEFDQPIGSFAGTWNCTVAAGTTATHIILTNEGYNATIAPGAMVTFGYQGAHRAVCPRQRTISSMAGACPAPAAVSASLCPR
jgi:hypothetical protein